MSLAELMGREWDARAGEAIRAAGGTVLEVRGEKLARVWCCARKASSVKVPSRRTEDTP